MQALVYERLRLITEGVKASLSSCSGFEENIIVGTIETLRLARADTLFEEVVSEDRGLTLDPDPRDLSSPIRSLSASIWMMEIFHAARREGLLRSSFTDAEALEWLTEMHQLFDVRRDMDEQAIADSIRKFVLPAFMPDSA